MTRRRVLITAASVVVLVGAGAVWWWVVVGPRLDSACDGVRPVGGFEVESELPADTPRPRTSGQSESVIDQLRGAPGATSGDAVFCGDFADPFILRADGFYYAYATNTRGANVPVLRSIDLVHGREVGDALPRLPNWSESGRTWGPSVLALDHGFVLFYSAYDTDSGLQCISAAVATKPDGPFSDSSKGPMICPTDLGGAIDPSPFVDDDDTLHLLWKNDGNAVGEPTHLWSQRLDSDGLSTAGDPHRLLSADQSWEAGIVEAPSMVEHGGVLYLFYSANAYNSAGYAVGYATCETVVGPCTKPANGPWLGGTEHAQGPGSAEAFRDESGDLWIVFHAWIAGSPGSADGVRSLFVARLTFVEGVPVTAT